VKITRLQEKFQKKEVLSQVVKTQKTRQTAHTKIRSTANVNQHSDDKATSEFMAFLSAFSVGSSFDKLSLTVKTVLSPKTCSSNLF
jgi:hypothetical protein